MNFTKMHGLGNDYVYVSTFDQHISDAPAFARAISDRHRGVGSDGLILIAPPDAPDAHVRMIMFNADGSRGEMCGNGIRCVAKYAYERGLARCNPLRVATDAGVRTLRLTLGPNDTVERICVDMGEPVFDPARIPVLLPGDTAIRAPLPLGARVFTATCVSFGNPHAVIFVPDTEKVPLADWGPQLERHPLFPQRMNVHFAQLLSPTYLKMITWERGSGATQACGSGACAVCVASVLTQSAQPQITTQLPGGELQIAWDPTSRHVLMTGPAEYVCDGVWLGPAQ